MYRLLCFIGVTAWLSPWLLTGCSFGPARVEAPKIDPRETAAKAIEQFDADGDQSISRSECKACPAMDRSFELYDANDDGSLSTEEIAGRLQAMLGTNIGRMPCMCIVYANNRPVVGALVEMIPEPFLGGALQPGSGVTNDRGVAKPVTIGAPPGLPGIEFGLYRVQITHDELKIPAKYNTETELGFELSPIERNRDTVEFRLKLR